MTEKQISEEDLEAACDAYDALTFGKTHGTHRASMQAALEALHARGWRRREDDVETVLKWARYIVKHKPDYTSDAFEALAAALKDTP